MDPASGIAVPVAFGAGVVSFLSPCVLPLVPGYISAVAGVTPEEVKARRVLGPTLAFVATFSVIFIALGLLGQQALRGSLTGPTAQKVSGALIFTGEFTQLNITISHWLQSLHLPNLNGDT